MSQQDAFLVEELEKNKIEDNFRLLQAIVKTIAFLLFNFIIFFTTYIYIYLKLFKVIFL